MGFRRTEYLTKRCVIWPGKRGHYRRSIEKGGLFAAPMTPTEADIEAVVEADDKGTRLYPEQSLTDYRLSTPSNLVHFASKFELYWVAVA
ncbi:MAG: hypothetical protein Ct9H90mP14_1000 [Methanobacteriota archaeon]|nr:MAG: hypothetical protein Ct9H90mP14_1000 [Euryarchaeota archaeon]